MKQKKDVKTRVQRSEIYWTIFKVVLIAIMLALLLFKKRDTATISVALSIVMTLIILLYLKSKNKERYIKDERTIRLSGYAVSWSWFVTLVVVTMLYWNDYIGLVNISAKSLITTIFLVMVISISFFRFYFFRKPDVGQ